MWPFGYKYDAFISHAVEDKLPVANELCRRLEEEGLKIWYSGKELSVGDSLEKSIHNGLNKSRYGVVILSPTYLSKNWPLREFYTLLTKEIRDKKVILPVLYDITPQELLDHDITMADKYAVSFDKGMDHVVERIVTVIKTSQPLIRLRQSLLALALAAVLAAVAYFISATIEHASPNSALIKQTVERRLSDFQQELDTKFSITSDKKAYKVATAQDVIHQFASFANLKTYYRNEFEFWNGITTVRAKKNVEPALGINLDALSPHNNYNLREPNIYLSTDNGPEGNAIINYVYVNTQRPDYTVIKQREGSDERYYITVRYTNNIRYWNVTLEYPPAPGRPKRTETIIHGFLPEEEFAFQRLGGEWTLAAN